MRVVSYVGCNSISKSIVEAHGGKIWAENNSDGRGATFTFTVPIQKPYRE
jgi:signal transduction histidine kinase